uniref:Integrase catalytic domain-containing protein n=1 Tax=Nicotiana tabacum TaxID=4097 RepID=A0A1S4A4R9_TOBAC|nr:PREDICTED: uncharacterized protein LOC107793756 [Nicotiana tabacum]
MSNQVTVRALFQERTSQGNYPLPAAKSEKKVEGQSSTDPEDIDDYSAEQMTVIQVNAKTRNLLYNAISGEEYEKISSCDTAKKMWDKLEVTYERTSKVKETRINLLVHDYELFQMKDGESIEEMYARFNKIIGDLKAFGRPYSSGEQVQKILRTFENNDAEALEEEIAMVPRNMNGLMRRCKNKKRGRMSSRRTRQFNEQDKNNGKYFECGSYGHVQAECPKLKRKVSRGFNKSKSFRSWSDEDNSEHEEISNLCFMTILENDMNKYSSCWTDEDDILDLSLKESQRMLNELKRLNREKNDWELKLEVCEIERDVLQEKFRNCNCNSMACTNPPVTVLSGLTKRPVSQLANDLLEMILLVKTPLVDPVKNPSLHTTNDKNLFKEVTKINRENVKFGDDSKGKIVGTRSVLFNNNCDITEFYLVDGLHYNLLSISQLCDSGYEVNFKKTDCAIEDESGKIILPGKRTASIRGKIYAFVVVDDYSRFTWVIFLAHKDEALKNFEIFCKKIEREDEYLFSIIQSDHGGEFESRSFEEFCNEQGYTHKHQYHHSKMG